MKMMPSKDKQIKIVMGANTFFTVDKSTT